MHFVARLFGVLLLLVVVLVAALAFVLYDPLSKGQRVLRPSQLITAPAGATFAPRDELSIERTDPAWESALARRYEPTLVVSGSDRFWPVSLSTLLAMRWNGHGPCLYVAGACRIHNPSLAAFATQGNPDDYLALPTPVDSISDSFRALAGAVGVLRAVVRGWTHQLSRADPFASAQFYFYYLPRTQRDSYRGAPGGLISLEYWFLYPLNYFPLARAPVQRLVNTLTAAFGKSDYHQGDLEHVAVLLDPLTLKPRYLWMARHANEGELYAWHSPAVQWSGDHASIYAALGSHASYAHCGIQRRSRTYRFINDFVLCAPGESFGFAYRSTPLVDLAHTAWACWRGHLGSAGRLKRGPVGLLPYETDGPASPLLQQENFGTACALGPGTAKPPAPL